MNHRAKIDERDDTDLPSNIVPFRPAVIDEPVSLGDAVAAVVMRLRTGFPRIYVQAISEWEEDEDRLL